MYTGYTFVFGRQTGSLPPGVTVIGSGGTAAVRTFDQGGGRYRLGFVVYVENVLNRYNYVGYSGTLTSPHYRQATAVAQPRRVQAGMNFNF